MGPAQCQLAVPIGAIMALELEDVNEPHHSRSSSLRGRKYTYCETSGQSNTEK